MNVSSLDTDDLYRELIIENYRNPSHKKELENATFSIQAYNPMCGDEIDVFFNLDNQKVKPLSFTGAGCSISQASANMICEAVEGKSVDEAEGLLNSYKKMLLEAESEPDFELLGDLEAFIGVKKYPVRLKCALLASNALLLALEDSKKAKENGK